MSPAEPAIQLNLLGTLSITVDGEAVALPNSRKTRGLLAYLAVTGRAERRDRLCELFWERPDDPRGALRWSLSKLRRLVDRPEQQNLIADRETVRLALPDEAIDFHRLRAIMREGTPDSATEVLRATVEDAGTFLEGLELSDCEAFNGWCIAQRESVRQWRVAVLNELTGRDIDQEEAVSLARSWTMLEPYSVAAWERLIQLLDRNKRTQEANQQRVLAVRVLTEANAEIPLSLRRAPRAAPSPAPADSPELEPIDQDVRFCRSSDGTRIAYAQIGKGQPLLRAGYWMNDLQRDLTSPIWRPWIDLLASGRSLVRYDIRGLGMSDHDAEQSIDLFVDDLSAVADAAQLEKFDLYGMAQGALTAIAYAARNPDRVRRVVLQSSYARGWMLRKEPQEIERRKATLTLATSGWKQNNQALIQMFLGLYLPEANEAQARWYEKFLQSMMVHPGTRELQEVLGHADVAALAEQVQAPTLIIHPRGEMIIPLAAGREVATRIPDAHFLMLDSSSHVIVQGDSAWDRVRTAIDDFLS